MTDFQELFSKARYGSYNDCYELRLTTHIYDPENLYKLDDIMHRDKWAADAIRDIEAGLQILKDYRIELAKKYAELETTASIPVIRLRRQRDFWKDHKVFYYLEEIVRYVDKPDKKEGTPYTDRVQKSTKYPGSERRQAIADYNTFIKNHPGIIAEKDIEKGKWER